MPRLPAILLLCLVYWVSPVAALALNEDERAWLAEHPVLHLGIDDSWPPFELRDAQGRYQGLAADYIALLEQRLGVSLQPSAPSSWSAVLEQAKAGQLDLLPAVMATPERQAYLAFTRPYLDFPIVILARDDGPQPRAMKDLYGLKIAVVEDYAPHELLRSQHPDLHLLPLPTVNAALHALAIGQADALIGDLASSVWSLRQLKLKGLIISGETPYRYQLAMAAPHDQAILIGILDKLLANIGSDEIGALQARWVDNLQDRRSVWRELLLYGLPGLLALCAIIAAILRINRRLHSEMVTRSLLEQELRNSEQHYRSLVENLSAIAWEARRDDHSFTYVSPHAEKLLGYPLADWKRPGFWLSTLHPEDAQRAIDHCQRESAAGRDRSLDYRMYTADGRLLWIRDIVTLTRNGDETIMRGLMVDISEAKQVEQALRLSEQKFASVFQQCPDILVIARRADGRLLDVNNAFEQQTGIPVSEALGKTASELNIWGIPDIGPTLLNLLQGKRLRNLEMPFQRRDGQRFIGLISAQAFQLVDTPALVIIVRDISQLKATQQQLLISEDKFAKAFHASPDGLLISRVRDGQLIEVNEGFSRITGYSSSEAAERSTLQLGIWANPADRARMIEQIGLHGRVRDLSAPIRTRAGQIRLCELSAQPIQVGDEPCLLTIARDITERQAMQEKLQQAATVFESTAEGVMITDPQQRIVAVNRAFSAITGFSEAEVLGQTPRLLASGQHDSAFYSAMWHQLEDEGHWQGEIWNKRKNAEIFPEWLTINAVCNQAQQTTHFVAVFADISSLKHAQARLDHQAHHDPLTGLPNRMLFETRLHAALDDAQTDDRQGAILFLDLDRFKHINDSLGHPVGDQLLKSIAIRLKEQLRDIDTVARLGGDEFILLLPGLHQTDDAKLVANKLLACFSPPFQVDDHQFYISASIGISLYPEDGLDVATLVKNADAAMYRAKAKGRNRVEMYTRDLTFQATERMALEHELRRALEREELHLYYQPKLSLSSQCLAGAEALIRWIHPVFGEIPPDRFIPLAEETGLILPLGDWVLQQACWQMREWQILHAPFGPLSVNLAGAQLRQPHLFERISRLLDEHALDPSLLQLEITESFIMNQTEDALSLLHQLKALGVQLAIDDFGTGYSSLSYLKRLPLDTLKIDKSFVRGLPSDPHDVAIARAIIALGRSMQLTVIAEGVETKAQELFLAAEGCEQIQGFVLSRPLAADVFAHNFLSPRRSVGATEKAPV
ncbi:EAL domain-containing protein [Pseudomonas sp. sp1636]|uniref:bifunctional diguanylate cyclase/phosphodiesterase n=1 Tax=Pseudomonas sp. sp1636 TaxID=3036707 RepID=UPI0025A4D93C|nr:EAL domain-containing protein [Pseudomonas sp. sp1636]MDM8350845.1 EAL domain-containing protein [Pseudomonas sp. sp1636]